MREWLLAQPVLIGHNLVRWDIPNLERVLGIKIKAELVDTLALSWYLWDDRKTHNLEGWGEEVGVEKPPIEDWEGLSLAEYVNRCESDVHITDLLWNRCTKYLARLYDCSEGDCSSLPIVKYLSFKLSCAAEQERSRWKLDEEVCRKNLEKLQTIADEKVALLRQHMPKVQKYREVTRPLKPYKKDGSLSSIGVKWQKYLSDQGLTKDHTLPIYVWTHEEEPNPSSPLQVKEWLYSLGWEPATFKYDRGEDGKLRPIPQVKKLMEPEFCDSVTALYDKEPALEILEGLSIANHRISILKGFLEKAENGFVKAEISGFTNTLRFKHIKPCVNLPGVDKLHGTEIRECLIARDGYELVGSDMTALEDLTKRHYIYPYDPDYVETMATEGFDPHLDLAERSGVLTPLQVENHKKGVENHKKIRQDYKKVNYSATYGIGAPKLARELRTTETRAKKLLSDYWDRNWAIKKFADDQKVRNIFGQKWVYNPVSKFWYSLRDVKDVFSTLNQSTGVFCFDSWIAQFRNQRPQLTAQFHDEVVLEIKKGNRDKATALLQDAIQRVNDEVKLNVKLAVDIKFGDNYASIH
jgi:hypothetical protein